MKSHSYLLSITLLTLFLAFALPTHALISDPTLYFSFDQTSGDLQNTTGTTYPVGTGITQTFSGIVGNAYDFSVTNTFINLTNASYLNIDYEGGNGNQSNFSYAILARWDVLAESGVFGKANGQSNDGVGLAVLNAEGALRIVVPSDDLAGSTVSTDWVCAVITYQANNRSLRFYENSSSFFSSKTLANDFGAFDPSASNGLLSLYLGGIPDAGYGNFDGKIDQFAFYKHTLTGAEAGEVCSNWSAGIDFIAPPNAAPIVQTVTLTATGNNQTLVGSANATDTNNDSITYFWTLFRNATAVSSGSNGTFLQGISVNFNNFSTGSVDGTYILQVIASDGVFNTSATNSSAVTVTFPGVANTPPVLVVVNASVTSNNLTLILSANATDVDNDTVQIFCNFFVNGSFSSASTCSGFLTQGVLVNFANASLPPIGLYTVIVEMTANDGFLNSSPLNSSPVTVSFPSVVVPPVADEGAHIVAISILLALLILAIILLQRFYKEFPEWALYIVGILVIGIILLLGLSLL